MSAEIRAPGRTHLCYNWRNMSAFFSTGFVWCLSSLGVFGDHLGSCPHWEDSDCPCVLLSALAHPTHLIIAKGVGSGCICSRQCPPRSQRGIIIFSVTLLGASSGQRSKGVFLAFS